MTIKLINISLLLALVTFNSYGEGFIKAEQKTSSKDLRVTASILKLSSHKEDLFELLSNGQGDRTILIDKNKLYRPSSVESEKIDNKFVKNFIKMKYSMRQADLRKMCNTSFILEMRGEKLKICHFEKEKIQMVKDYLLELKRAFKAKSY